MTCIGIGGGHLTCRLGTIHDVQLFFKCINNFAVFHHANKDWSLLTDRLYRRYLRLEELASASDLMKAVKEIFSSVSISAVNWEELAPVERDRTWLDFKQETLDLVFSNFFDSFQKAKKVFYISIKNVKIIFPSR